MTKVQLGTFNLAAELWHQREAGVHTDVKIVGKDGLVHSHKSLIANSCSAFKEVAKNLGEDVLIIAKDFSVGDVIEDLKKIYLYNSCQIELPFFELMGKPVSKLDILIKSSTSVSRAFQFEETPAIPAALINPTVTDDFRFKVLENTELDCQFCHRSLNSSLEKCKHEETCLRQKVRTSRLDFDAHPDDVQGDSFECLYCDTVCGSVQLLRNHIKIKHIYKDELGNNWCSICYVKITRRQHEEIHLKEEYRRHKCDYCDSRFITKTKKEEHERSRHTGLATLKCKFCNDHFTTSSKRADHQRLSCKRNPDRKLSVEKGRQKKGQDTKMYYMYFDNQTEKEKPSKENFQTAIGGDVNSQIMELLKK